MVKVRCLQGDITQAPVEAIVNAANNALRMGGGVAGASRRAGGKEIEEEAVRKGPVPIGEAVVTGAGKLPAKYVIHAAVMGLDLVTDGEKIRAATRNSLLRAKELGIKSVAFPALGTGVGGFPYRDAARIMVEEVAQDIKGQTSLEEIVFVLFDEEAYRAFQKAVEAKGRKE